MSERIAPEVESALGEYVASALPGWQLRVVWDFDRQGAMCCLDNSSGYFRRKFFIPRAMLDDAPASGGSPWIVATLTRQGVLDKVLESGDERVDAPIIVQYPDVG